MDPDQIIFASGMGNFIRELSLPAVGLIIALVAFLGIELCNYLLGLPLRRQERANLFLDLIETGLKSGHSIEETIISVSKTRERSLGVHFQLLAAWIESGLRLPEALAKVPHFLPPQIVAMLKVGVDLGDLPRVLPACRRLLQDGSSQVRKAHSYLIVLAFALTPGGLFVLPYIFIRVVPKFEEIMKDLTEGAPMPQMFQVLSEWRWEFVGVQVACLAVVWLGTLYYVGGPRVLSWFEKPWSLRDRIVCALPWRWKRLQRDFSGLLALLLDANVPEEKAVALAADGTANAMFRRRAQAAVEDLRRGVKLPDALRHMDDSGEFRWRMTHAAHARSGFFAALAGWHDALDAKAFQQEQATAHGVTTGLVLVNGAIVGFTCIVLFQLLTGVLNSTLLW